MASKPPPWKGEKMQDRGISLHFIPRADEPGTYILSVFKDKWQMGINVLSEGVIMTQVEFDDAWVESIPDDQLIVLVMEAITQIAIIDRDPDEARTFRESVAREIKATGIGMSRG
jgi:hypothetical protein